MADTPVLIAGAGPTGLVLALWLMRLGVQVRIIDKVSEPGTTSRALAVQARTLELYHQVGLDDAVIAGGVKIQNLNLWVKGRPMATVQLTGAGKNLTPYSFALVFPQDDHERLLIERLDGLGVRVERRTELLRFTQNAHGVTATLRGPDGAEETCDAEYIAGCDGASSAVRAQLGFGFPGGTYTGLFYVADVVATGAPTNKDLHADIEDADFLLLFPLEGDHHWRLVGTVHDLPAGEQGALAFDDVKGKAMEHLRLNVQKVNWFSSYRVHHRVALRFRDRRAFVLGDAAHIHSPVGGQGMNTGIGDAVNLAWKLALALKGGSSDKILDTYEPERIAFARQLVATTDRGFVLITSRGALATLIRTRIVPLVLPQLFRLRAFRELLFRTVSQTQVNYRNGALSQGAAGKVRGGDRLPWVRLDSGQDNFEPLRSVDWQVHVYGEAQRALSDACAELRVPLHVFGWKTEMQRAGLQKDALYLVRPDGYVGLADADANVERLRRYLAIWLPGSAQSSGMSPTPV
jgi:2-polyprenyl-6-methoxyphenol hydroxylase-like FAD-dependent oxidoreductase